MGGDCSILPGMWSRVVQGAFTGEAEHCTPEYFTQEFAHRPDFDAEGIFFVTTRGQCAGTCLLWPDVGSTEVDAQVHWLAVDNEHRRLGLGRVLLLLALHRAKARGFQRALLRASGPSSEAVAALGQNLGFMPVASDATK